ncbi:hypothetical protein F-S17_0421 [Faustovirus]|nr:hypothetical protein F-S17_0421 [Faustovirus]
MFQDDYNQPMYISDYGIDIYDTEQLDSPIDGYYTYSCDSTTPDIVYVEVDTQTNSDCSAEYDKDEVSTPTTSSSTEDIRLTIPDLVKSRSRGAKNKAQQIILDVIKSEPKLKSKIKKSAKYGRVKTRKLPSGRIIPHVKRGVKVERDAQTDAELSCLGRDAAFLRQQCEYLYNYYEQYHVDNKLPMELIIHKILNTLIARDNFRMLIRTSTGTIVVDTICAQHYIEIVCGCGTFHRYTEDLKTK